MTMPGGEFLVYTDPGGLVRVQVRLHDGTVWLSQAQMADLYGTTPQNITQHLRAIYEEGEQDEEATCKPYLRVRREGSRDVRRSIKHYNLAAIHQQPRLPESTRAGNTTAGRRPERRSPSPWTLTSRRPSRRHTPSSSYAPVTHVMGEQ